MIGKVTLISILVIAFVSITILMSHVVYFSPAPQQAALEIAGQGTLDLTTDTWGIFDPKTGEVLLGNNIDTPRPIASVTKLFTAYATLETHNEKKATDITWSDLNTEGRAGKLYYGEHVTLGGLLFPLLLESSNDAGTAIGRTLGSDFDTTIAQLKEHVSLTDTTIVDASGLSPKNVSDVTDLARFYTFLRSAHPHVTDITQLRMYVGEDTGLINNNPARAFPTFTGGKHGYLDEAGRTFVGTFKTAPDGPEVGIIFLGSADLTNDLKRTLAYVGVLE